MEKLLGIAASDLNVLEVEVTDSDIQEIMSLKNPPLKTLGKDDIYVRKCRLTGTMVNCYHGRFREKDIPFLLEQTRGRSMLIGHKKDEAGIGRFFGGDIGNPECCWWLCGDRPYVGNV